MHALSANIRGILYMVLATGTFVANDTLMKLATEGLMPFQTLFLRGISASLWCLPLVLLTGNGRRILEGAHPIVLLRNSSELLAVLCFVVALASMPLADVTAISQVAPMAILIGVAVLYGDRIGALRMGLIALGFLGALLVAQPTLEGISPFALLAFVSAILAAGRDIIGRKVPPAIPVVVVAYSTIIVVMVGAGIATLLTETWRPVEGRHLLLLAGAGLFLTVGHFFVFLSYRTAPTGVVAPFFYLFAVWAVISGALVFGTIPNALAIVGIALILIGGVTIALLDERKRRLTPLA